MGRATAGRVFRSIRAGAAAAGAALVLTLASAPASAAPGTSAEDLFQQARKLVQDGDVSAACVKFQASLDAEFADGTLLALAACHEKEGKLATASNEFHLVASSTTKPAAEKLAREHIASLETQIPTLAITLPRIDGLAVKVDGHPITAASLAAPIPLDPGDRAVDVSAPGYRSWSAHVTLVAGTPATLAVPALDRDAPPPVVAPPAPVLAPRSSTNGRRTAAYVVGGAGVATLGVGVVTGILALGKASTIKDHCDSSYACQTQDAVDAGSAGATLSVVSTITVIAGLAGIGAGAFLFFTSKGDEKAAATTAVLPLVSRDAGGVSVLRRF